MLPSDFAVKSDGCFIDAQAELLQLILSKHSCKYLVNCKLQASAIDLTIDQQFLQVTALVHNKCDAECR